MVLGGLHVQACQDECAPHADALASVTAFRSGGDLRDVESAAAARYVLGFGASIAPTRRARPCSPARVSDHGESDRDARLPQPVRFLLSGDAQPRAAYRVRNPRTSHEIEAAGQPYAVFPDNNLGGNRLIFVGCARPAPAGKDVECRGLARCDRRSGARPRDGVAGCAGVFIGFETLNDSNLGDSRKRPSRRGLRPARKLLHDHGIQVNGSFVVGSIATARKCSRRWQWIDDNRLECATFHILTPYPGTPLFRQMEAEPRLLHRNWDLYDTAHAVFRPEHLTPEELELGYDSVVPGLLFSHTSIWGCLPAAVTKWPSYFGGAYLYKRSNRLWRFLIRNGLVRAAWRPLVACARRRQRSVQHRLEAREMSGCTVLSRGRSVS